MSKTTTWFQLEFDRITAVQVVRHTDKSVVLWKKAFTIDRAEDKFEEVRRARLSDWRCYFPSWRDAHAHLLAKAEAELAAARHKLQAAQSRHGNVKGMKPPKN